MNSSVQFLHSNIALCWRWRVWKNG